MNNYILYLRTDICMEQINTGGSVGHTLGVINAFLEKKITCYVFSSQMHIVLNNEKKIIFRPLYVGSFFWIVRWRFGYLRWRLESFFSTFSFFFQVLYFSKNIKFSYIYQRYSILNFTGLLLSWYKKIPLILEYNGSEAYWFDISSNDVWYRRWFAFKKLSYFVENLNIKYAQNIVVVSQALKEDLVKRGINHNKILVNPNGVDSFYFESNCVMKERDCIRSKYDFNDTFVFGFIGTFGHWHGIEVLEYIIPIICNLRPEARFLLIGDGLLKDHAQEILNKYMIEGKVIFTGKIAQDQAPHYLASCDAFLCPTQPNADGTRFFGSPTKLFEYMSMAKPVLASDLEQLAEVISPAIKIFKDEDYNIIDEVGFSVDPLDWDAWVKACCMCIDMDNKKRYLLGNNARNKVLNQYTWQKHVERILSHIKGIEDV